jgi:PAS domain S-box-containing protein
MGIKFNNLWNQTDFDLYGNKPPQQILLKEKGDQLHVLMLIMVFIFSILFTIANLLSKSPVEAILTFVPAPVIVLFYFFLFKKNKTVLSKIAAVILIILMLSILSLIGGPKTGILSFFIPVIVGALITLQGKEFKYALYLTFFSFFILLFLLYTDFNIGIKLEISESKLVTERIQNYIGSSFATAFEVGYLIIVTNKLQSNLLATTQLLEDKNEELSTLLASNSQKTIQISDQLEQIRKTEMELQKLSLIATQTKNGVIITDAMGRIEWVNHAFEEITGWQLAEIIGKRPKDFLLRDIGADKTSDMISQKLKNKEFVHAIISNYTKEGNHYYNQIEINPIFDASGKHTNFISIQRDITKEIKAKKVIEQLNERYELVVNKVTNDMIWELELETNKIINAIQLLSADGRKFNVKENGIPWTLKFVHHEDRDVLLNKINYALENKVDNWECEYRYMNDNGIKGIYLDRGYIIYNEDALPCRIIFSR